VLLDAVVKFGLLLEVCLVILIIWRGAISAYPWFFSYALAHFVADVVQIVVLHESGRSSHRYNNVYWIDAIVLDALLFLTVITLTYKALEGKPHQSASGRILLVIVGLTFLLPFAVFYHKGLFSYRWLVGARQMLLFGAAVMNLALWTAIISMRPREPRLLTVSAGVGMATAGTALFYGIVPFTSGTLKSVADILLGLTQALAVLICCWAFWSFKRRTTTS